MIDPAARHRSLAPGLWATLIAACALLLHGTYFDIGIKNLIDLGVLSVDSERILNGQVFSRDFIAPYGPGRYYLVAAAFRIFGASMTTLCAVFLAMRVLVDVVTFLLARRLLPILPALGVTMCVAAAHGPTHKGFLTLGLVLFILAAARAFEKPSASRLFLLGAVIGVVGSFRYDLGAMGVILGPAVLIAGRRGQAPLPGLLKAWCAFLGGILLLSLPGGLLILAGDPARLIECEWTRAALLREAQSPGQDAPASLLAILLLASPPLVLFLSFPGRRKIRFPDQKAGRFLLILVSLCGILLFTQYLIEPKINRLLQVGPPLFISAFFLFHAASGWVLPNRIQWISSLVLIVITGWYVAAGSGDGSIDSPAVLARSRVRLEGARAGFSCGPRLAEELTTALDWASRSSRNETFYASPSIPLLYFLSGKENPAPVTDFSYVLRNREIQEWVIDALEKKEVQRVLYKPGVIQGFVPEEEAPELTMHLRALFPRSTTLPNGYRVYSR